MRDDKIFLVGAGHLEHRLLASHIATNIEFVPLGGIGAIETPKLPEPIPLKALDLSILSPPSDLPRRTKHHNSKVKKRKPKTKKTHRK